MGFSKSDISAPEWKFFLDLAHMTMRTVSYYRHFDSIKVEHGHITHLGLAGNGITGLPTSLDNLKYLKILDVAKNPKVWIPPSFSDLINLEECYFDSNHGVDLPSTLYKLKYNRTQGLGPLKIHFTTHSYGISTLKNEAVQEIYRYAESLHLDKPYDGYLLPEKVKAKSGNTWGKKIKIYKVT